MMKRILAVVILALFCALLNAQDFMEEYKVKSIDVEEIKIGQKLDYNQFVLKFGKPDRYERNELGSADDPCLDEYYWVGKNFFSFTNNGTFCEFFLRDNRFAALTLWIPGGVRVGDHLSKLDDFKYGKPIVASWLEPKNGLVEYVLFYGYMDDLVYLSVKDEIIQIIHYSASF